MPFRIRIERLGDGKATPLGGKFVCTFDPEPHGGRGNLTVTANPFEALAFATMEDAIRFWRQTSKTVPVRHDGKPNRPLTAYTVEFFETPAH